MRKIVLFSLLFYCPVFGLYAADWIGHAENAVRTPEGSEARNALWLRKTFEADRQESVTIRVATFGYHEIYLNGQQVPESTGHKKFVSVLEPAVSNLAVRVMQKTYTADIQKGKNCLAVWLGHGWSGYTDWLDISQDGFHVMTLPHGPAILVEVRSNAVDKKFLLESDGTWKVSRSSYSKTGHWKYFEFGGEVYDARLAEPDWCKVAFDDSSWKNVSVVNVNKNIEITPQMSVGNGVVQTFNAVSVEQIGAKKYRIDMGKLYNGWLRIPFTGKEGETVTLKYQDRALSEFEKKPDDPNNDFSYGQIDKIILSGNPERDVFQNKFNYQTFRWLVVEGAENLPPPEKITGQLIRTNYDKVSTFACSNERYNKIYNVITHTYECLTLGGYIVDCSHRERLGYGAEGQASMTCGFTNFDQNAMFRKWMGDWRDVQMKDGSIPNTAPTTWGGGGPAWKLVCVTLPWEHYVYYGDKSILEENYAMMKRHLEMLHKRIQENKERVLPTGGDLYNGIGDWYTSLDIDPPQNSRPIPWTFRQFFSNCFVVMSYQTMVKIANELGESEDAAMYQKLADELAKSVHEKFYNAEIGVYADLKEQTAFSFPLYINLPPQNVREKIEQNLLEDITKTKGGHLTTGVLGSWIQLKYLNQIGRNDLVASALMKDDKPSYGFFLKNGLTAVPEAWNIYGSGSRCHTSFLSGGAWFINAMTGIIPDEKQPGFKHFFVKPSITEYVNWVKTTHQTVRGMISVEWKKTGNRFTLRLTVPKDSSATVYLPSGKAKTVGEGQHVFRELIR